MNFGCMSSFLSPDFLKVFVPLAGGVFAWLWNEQRRRVWEEYQRKEERYQKLLLAIRGFYRGTQDTALKQSFIDELKMCWLYCPDEVIRKGNVFLSTVLESSENSAKQKALGDFISTIRKDLLSRKVVSQTELGAHDFKHYYIST